MRSFLLGFLGLPPHATFNRFGRAVSLRAAWVADPVRCVVGLLFMAMTVAVTVGAVVFGLRGDLAKHGACIFFGVLLVLIASRIAERLGIR